MYTTRQQRLSKKKNEKTAVFKMIDNDSIHNYYANFFTHDGKKKSKKEILKKKAPKEKQKTEKKPETYPDEIFLVCPFIVNNRTKAFAKKKKGKNNILKNEQKR